MYRSLFPASAEAFAARSKPCVVLEPNYSEWLAGILKEAKQSVRRRRDSTRQAILLTELLTPDTAIWTLCEVDLLQRWYTAWQEGGTAQRPKTYCIQAHVVHVEMISQHEIGFKLTPEAIQDLIEIYDGTVSYHMSSSNSTGPEEETTPESKERKDFVQRVNRFVFRTHISALAALKSDGTGTLLGIQAKTAREAVESLLAYVTIPCQDDSLLPTQGGWQMNRQEGPFLKDVRLEDALSDMTIPYTVYPYQIFSPGQPSSCLIPFPQHGQHYPSTHIQSPSLYPLLQWPSAITGGIWREDEFAWPEGHSY